MYRSPLEIGGTNNASVILLSWIVGYIAQLDYRRSVVVAKLLACSHPDVYAPS